jgi:hypothetical protein
MVTGALRLAGARSAGQEAIADASDAQDARMAFLRNRKRGMRQHILWVIEDRTRMEQCVEVENIVVGSGRRPHGLLHS